MSAVSTACAAWRQAATRCRPTSPASPRCWRIGAEYLHWKNTGQWQLLARGEYVFTSAPADLTRRFPADAWNAPTLWDLTGLDGFVQLYDLNVGDWTIDIPRPTVALWIGDTWKVGSDLTLNYGVRWEADWRALDPPLVTTGITFNPVGGAPLTDVALRPGDRLSPGGLRDINNIAPRAGFTWAAGGARQAVIRGGCGLYFSTPDANTAFSQQSFNSERILVNSFPYDGRSGFVGDPMRGRTPVDTLSGRVPLPPSRRASSRTTTRCRTRGRARSDSRRKWRRCGDSRPT